MTILTWEPPAAVSLDEILKISNDLLAESVREYTSEEDVFRIEAVGMNWDIGCRIYQPSDPSRQVIGPDGKKAGIFLLHGGQADHRYFESIAPILAGHYGYKVVCMTFPGRLYLLDPSRNWPDDTINADGTCRTPIWCTDNLITRDQYNLIEDRTNLSKRKKWGTLMFLEAKEGTEFYYRMAAWPVAFDEGMRECLARHFPVGEYSVYAHGHSTGGSFVHYLSQRVENVTGILDMESSPFGYLSSKLTGHQWNFPFNYLTLRTWRHIARYLGPEAGQEGAERLPMLMEEVFEAWDRSKHYPQFKAEYFIHMMGLEALQEAARVTAKRLNMNRDETDALLRRYEDYTREISGPGVKPLPPILVGLAKDSVNQTLENYSNIMLPAFAAMKPAPKVRITLYQAGLHAYMKPREGLPMGVGPAVIKVWHEAITSGYFK